MHDMFYILGIFSQNLLNVTFIALRKRVHTLVLLTKSVFTSRDSQNKLVLGLTIKEFKHHLFVHERLVCVSDSIDHGDCVSIMPLLILDFVQHGDEGSDACSMADHEDLYWVFSVLNWSWELQDSICLTELTFDFQVFGTDIFLVCQELRAETFIMFIVLLKLLFGEHELEEVGL